MNLPVLGDTRTGHPWSLANPGAMTSAGAATTWTPVVDGGRVALIGVVTGLIAATLGSAAVLRQPPWPRMTIHTDQVPGHHA
ncbi:hypothetical protein [Gordonia aquimaris]